MTGQITINRPVAEVFAFVADERNVYDPAITATRLLTAEPIGRGTRFASVSRSLGRRVEMEVEIVEHDPPRRLVTVTRLPGMRITSGLHFGADVAGGTRLHWSSQVHTRGALRLAAPLIQITGRRQTAAIWRNLKHVMEQQAPMAVGI